MYDNVLKVYLAGPMSGIPQFNYPAFMAASEKMRSNGLEVYNPAEMDDPDVQKASLASKDGAFTDNKVGGGTWGDFLSADVKIVADEVDAVVMLPGWGTSRGARLEAFVALQIQKPVFEYVDGILVELSPTDALEVITYFTIDQGDVSRYG